MPWMPFRDVVKQAGILWELQFGHDTNAVDARLPCPFTPHLTEASIRPRHQCRGCASDLYQSAISEALQFGHDTNAVDAAGGRLLLISKAELQFGHDTNAVDAGEGRVVPGGEGRASIRPRHQCRGCSLGGKTNGVVY